MALGDEDWPFSRPAKMGRSKLAIIPSISGAPLIDRIMGSLLNRFLRQIKAKLKYQALCVCLTNTWLTHFHPVFLPSMRTILPPSISAPVAAQDDIEVYVRCLLPKKRGFPLWVPKPHRNLPYEYRKKGVSIGDVGIVTSSGVFDFLFNICLPAHHPINGNLVPDNFRPLEPPPNPLDIIEDSDMSTHLTSGSITLLRSNVEGSMQHRYVPLRVIVST
jgi:hypothetical protein